MLAISKTRLKYADNRIAGLGIGKAWQKASGNKSLKNCYKIGSRVEKVARIRSLINAGIEQAQIQFEQKRAEMTQEHLDRIKKVSELEKMEKIAQKQAEGLKPAYTPRDDSHLEVFDQYPSPAQCGGTVKGYIPTNCKRVVPQRKNSYPW